MQSGWLTGKQVEHQYYADGSLKYAHDVGDSRFDRAYSYYQMGNINQTGAGTTDGPYRQSYRYDVWGNIKRRDNRYWSGLDTYAADYDEPHSRNHAWQYDAAGHVKQDESLVYVFDARGRNIRADNLQGTASVSNLKWRNTAGDSYRNLSEPECNDLRRAVGAVQRLLNHGSALYDYDFFLTAGATSKGTLIGGNKFWNSRLSRATSKRR